MKRLADVTDVELDRLFAGAAPGSELDDVAALFAEIRAVFARLPASEIAERHIATMAEAARATAVHPAASNGSGTSDRTAPLSQPRWSRTMNNRIVALTAKLAAACVALMAMTAGLAFAGVDLPGRAAEKAFAAVLGVELPNQAVGPPEDFQGHPSPTASPGSVSAAVLTVIDGWSGANGCAFGHEVATAAGGTPATCGRDPEGNRTTPQAGTEEHRRNDDAPAGAKRQNDDAPAGAKRQNDDALAGAKRQNDDAPAGAKRRDGETPAGAKRRDGETPAEDRPGTTSTPKNARGPRR